MPTTNLIRQVCEATAHSHRRTDDGYVICDVRASYWSYERMPSTYRVWVTLAGLNPNPIEACDILAAVAYDELTDALTQDITPTERAAVELELAQRGFQAAFATPATAADFQRWELEDSMQHEKGL